MITKSHHQTCKQVAALMRAYRPLVHWLWEWKIDVVPGEINLDEPTSSMSIHYENYSLDADLVIRPAAIKLTAEDLELAFLHELGHLLFVEIIMAHQNLVAAAGGTAMYVGAWKDAEERACWRFARAAYALRHAS